MLSIDKNFEFLLQDLKKLTVSVYTSNGEYLQDIKMDKTGNSKTHPRGNLIECIWRWEDRVYKEYVRDFIHKVGSVGDKEFYGRF